MGWKATLTVQELPGGSEDTTGRHEPPEIKKLSVESLAMKTLFIFRVAVPVLVTVTDFAGLVWPTAVGPKVSSDVESATAGVPAGIALPERLTTSTPASEVISIVPECDPVDVGSKTTWISQLCSEPNVGGQVSVPVKGPV